MTIPRALALALCLAVAVCAVQSKDAPSAPHLNLLDLYERASHSEHMDAVTDVVKSELRNGYKIEMVGNYTVKQMVELFVETVKRSETHGKSQFEKGWSSLDDYICLALKGCHGHGKCMGMKGGCKCKAGFGDLDCSETLQDSKSCSRECSNNGECIAKHGKAPYCKCEEGWGGPSCRVPVCARRCTNHGRCEVHIPISAACNCDDGFGGNDCSVKVPKTKKKQGPADVSLDEDPATDIKHKGAEEPNGEVPKENMPKKSLQPISCPNNCSGDKGYCSDSEKICYCKAGFTGPDCSITQKCPEKCDERGKCIDGVCYCLDGYSGADCSKESFRCPDNCSGHGICEKDTCLCDKGYEGSSCALRHAGGQPLNVLGESAETNPHTPPEIEYKVEGKEVDQEAPRRMDTAAQAEEQVRKNPDPRPKLEEAEAETYTIPGEEKKETVTKEPNVSIARKTKDDQEGEKAKASAGSTMSMEEKVVAKKAGPASKEEPVVRFDHAAAIVPENGHVDTIDASAVLASAGVAGAKMAPTPAPTGAAHVNTPAANKIIKGASAAAGSASAAAHSATGTVVNNDQVPAHVTSEQEQEFQDAEHNLKRTVQETQGASEAKAKQQDSVIHQNAVKQEKKMDALDTDAHKVAADSASTVNQLSAQVNKVKAIAEGDEALAKAELVRAEKDMDQHLEDNQASVRRAREEQEKKSDAVSTELVESNQEHTSVENNMQNEIDVLKQQITKQNEQHLAAMQQESREVEDARAAEVEAKKEMADAVSEIKKQEEIRNRIDSNNAQVEATAEAQKQQAQENAAHDALRASEGAREASAIINQAHHAPTSVPPAAPGQKEQADEVNRRKKIAADKAKLTKQKEEDVEAEKEQHEKNQKEEEQKDAADLNKEYNHDDPEEIKKDKEAEAALARQHRDQEEATHKANQQKEDDLRKLLDADSATKKTASPPITPPKGATDPSEKLDKAVADMMENSHAPGVSTFMGASTKFFGNGRVAHSFNTKTNQVVDVSAKALNDKSTHMIASVSKTITWTALSMLMDKGAFDLDDDIHEHLDFSVRNPNHPDTKVTFRQLYSHHTGIKDPSGDALDATYGYNADDCASINAADKLESFLKSYLATKAAWGTEEPGSRENYSNVATGLAGLLVEKISKMPFKDFCKKHIFDFLGMTSTAWMVPDLPSSAELVVPYRWDNDQVRYTQRGPFYCFVDYPSGQLYTTASDAAKFFRAAANHGMSPDNENTCLYSRYTGKLAFQKSMGSWGLGWSLSIVDGYPSCPGHNGGEYGTSTLVLLCPSTQGGGRVAGAFANIEDAELNHVVKKLMDNHANVPAPSYGSDCTNTWTNPNTPEDETPEHQEKEGIKDHNTAEQTHAENAETKERENASKEQVQKLKDDLKGKTSKIEDDLHQEEQKIEEEEKKQLAEATAQAEHAENDAKLEIAKAEHDAKSKIADVENSSKQHATSTGAGNGVGDAGSEAGSEAAIAAADREAAIVKEEAAKEVAAVKEKAAAETSASQRTEQATVDSAKKRAAIEEHAAIQKAAEEIEKDDDQEASEEANVDQKQAKATAAVNSINTNSEGSSHEVASTVHDAPHEEQETHSDHSVETTSENSRHTEHPTGEEVHNTVVDHSAEVSITANSNTEHNHPEAPATANSNGEQQQSHPHEVTPSPQPVESSPTNHTTEASPVVENHNATENATNSNTEHNHPEAPATANSNGEQQQSHPHEVTPSPQPVESSPTNHTTEASPVVENHNATENANVSGGVQSVSGDIIHEVKQPIEVAPEDLSWSSGAINAPKMKSSTSEATSNKKEDSTVKSTSTTTASSNDVATVSTGSGSSSSTSSSSSGKGLHSMWAKVMLGVIAATTLAVVVGMAVIAMWKREVIPSTHRDNFTAFMA